MAVITNKQKTLLSKAFIEQGELVLCIGKSDAWATPYSDTSPEPEISSVSTIDDAIAYKTLGNGAHSEDANQCIIAYAKVDNVNGTVEYHGVKYSLTYDSSTALNNGYTSVYVKCTLIRDEIPTSIAYRKIGLFINTQGTFGTDGTALPAAITDPGTLVVVDYRKPIYRDADLSEVIELVIPF